MLRSISPLRLLKMGLHPTSRPATSNIDAALKCPSISERLGTARRAPGRVLTICSKLCPHGPQGDRDFDGETVRSRGAREEETTMVATTPMSPNQRLLTPGSPPVR
jgi:hypothetical protein